MKFSLTCREKVVLFHITVLGSECGMLAVAGKTTDCLLLLLKLKYANFYVLRKIASVQLDNTHDKCLMHTEKWARARAVKGDGL